MDSFYVTPTDFDIAESNGINPNALYQRIRNMAWSKEKAIKTPLRQKRNMKELAKIAEQNGIEYRTMLRRIQRGWEPERAVTQSLTNRKELMIKNSANNRIYPKEIIEMANSNGVSYSCFLMRIKRGWTLERASETKTLTSAESGKIASKESYWSKGPRVLRKG